MNRFILVCLFSLCFYMLLMSFGNTEAYTIEDFSNYIEQIDGQSTNSQYINTLINYYRGCIGKIKTDLASHGVDISKYNYFAISRGNSGSFVIDFHLATTDITGFMQSGYGAVKYSPRGISYRLTYSNNNYNVHCMNYSDTWISYKACSAFIGLNNSANYTGNYQLNGYAKVVWWVAEWYNPTEYLVYHNLLDNSAWNGNLYTYYQLLNLYQNNRIKIGYIEPKDSYYYEFTIKNKSNNIIIGESFVNLLGNTNNSDAVYIDNEHGVFLNTIYLDYSTQYEIDIDSYYGSGGDNKILESHFIIFLPLNAQISGDTISSLGSGDFTNRDSAIMEIDAINTQTGVFQNLYNELFTLDSGDIDDLYGVILEKYPSGESGDILYFYKKFDELFSSEPQDFVISWDNIPVNLTFLHGETLVSGDIISANSINFDAMCRDNETLGIIKFWLNTILSFSLFYLFAVEFYKCWLQILGVSTSIADDMVDDEEVIVDSVRDSSTVNRKTGQITEKPIVISHTKYKKR